MDTRKPITPKILGDLCMTTDKICFSHFEAVLFQTFFSIMFFAALRVSELIAIKKQMMLFLRIGLLEF